MTDHLLTTFRSAVPLPDATTVGQAYNKATRDRREAPHHRLALTAGIAVCTAVAALALVPIGGASLGARAVNGISNLWATPPNQPALDRAAEDAQTIAGGGYYTEARVDDAANKVDLYLADAPQSVIDQLEAKHPGTYVIDNDAAHPLSELLKIEHSLPLSSLQSKDIDVVTAAPTPEGYLSVGVSGNSDVLAAQSVLDSMYGPGIIKVFGGAKPGIITPDIVTVRTGQLHPKH